jgi:hypothetical protein
MREADEVWNRAAMAGDPQALYRPGDRALAGLLRGHSEVMSGGLDFMCDTLTPDEIEFAAAGFDYFGRPDAAVILRQAAHEHDEQALAQLEERYDSAVPSDASLVELFEARWRLHPSAFAPISR